MAQHLHILNSTGIFDDISDLVESQFSSSINTISKLIDVPDIDIVVDYSKQVIPETGISGYSPSAHTIYLYIDPNNENLTNTFEEEFTATLGHEIHHCIRHIEPGYGSTLIEALITEGLACHFETEVRNGKEPFYATALKPQDLPNIVANLRPLFNSSEYDHQSLFYGSDKQNIARFTGYSVGFYLVNKYISNYHIPASKLANTPISTILEP